MDAESHRRRAALFVVRKPDAGDQRISRVYLTKAGRAIRAKVQSVWQTMEEEPSGFTLEERAVLRQFLVQIRENLIRATGEKTPW